MAKDKLDKLRQENHDLKSQIADLQEELTQVKCKIASNPTNDDLAKSVDFLSNEYDDLKTNKISVVEDLKHIESKLYLISKKVCEIDDAIESIVQYSYQYNVKILGVPQESDTESAEQTVNICVKLFQEMGANITSNDIDIAHRIPNRTKTCPAPIVCKFTRRIAKEAVMKKKKEINKVDLRKLVSTACVDDVRLEIFDHLTPKQQELLRQTKIFQRENNFAFCWVKNQVILLREVEDGKIIRIKSQHDLDELKGKFSNFCDLTESYSYPDSRHPLMFPSPESNWGRGSYRGGPYRGGSYRGGSYRGGSYRGESQRNGPRTRSKSSNDK